MFQVKLTEFKAPPVLLIPGYTNRLILSFCAAAAWWWGGAGWGTHHLVTINTAPAQVMMPLDIDGPFVSSNGSVI